MNTQTQQIGTQVLIPGQDLEILVPQVTRGQVTVKYERVTYEQVLELVAGTGKSNGSKRSKRSKTRGALVSRKVARYAQAIRTGKWATGANYSIEEAFQNLIKVLEDLKLEELTLKAKDTLDELLIESNLSFENRATLFNRITGE